MIDVRELDGDEPAGFAAAKTALYDHFNRFLDASIFNALCDPDRYSGTCDPPLYAVPCVPAGSLQAARSRRRLAAA